MTVKECVFLQPLRLVHCFTKMVSSFTNAKAEPDLFQHQVKIKTRNGKLVPINCVFMVSFLPHPFHLFLSFRTLSRRDLTLVLSSLFMGPQAHTKTLSTSIRTWAVLGSLELIGPVWVILPVGSSICHVSVYSDDHDLVDDNEERVQIVQKIIDELKLTNIIFCGHSRGLVCYWTSSNSKDSLAPRMPWKWRLWIRFVLLVFQVYNIWTLFILGCNHRVGTDKPYWFTAA